MSDRLGSWVDGDAKAQVLEFVVESADESQETFIPISERIATFDNDGTLWVEKPVPVQAPFLVEKLIGQVKADPSLATQSPYQEIINQDPVFLNGIAKQVPEVVATFLSGTGAAWAGTSTDEYEEEVLEYLRTHQDEHFGRPHTDMVYRPMMELIDLLKAYDWAVYVCSGGGRDFMRAFCEDTWGIPRENIIGSAPEWVYEDGRLVRENALRGSLALGPGKPSHIYARTGRMPRFAAGNGDVDIEMLEVADFALVVVHDDAAREHEYTAGAEAILERASSEGWTMASMKNDWNVVFD